MPTNLTWWTHPGRTGWRCYWNAWLMGWNSWDIGWHWWNIRRKVLWIWVSTYLWPGRIVVFCLEAMIFVVWWWILNGNVMRKEKKKVRLQFEQSKFEVPSSCRTLLGHSAKARVHRTNLHGKRFTAHAWYLTLSNKNSNRMSPEGTLRDLLSDPK